MNLFTKQKTTDVENKLMVIRGKWRGGMNWEIRIDIYTLPFIKEITNKDLLYTTGNSTQYSNDLYGYGVDICVYITDSLCCIAEINTTL